MQPENSLNQAPGVEQLPMPPVAGFEQVPSLPPLDSRIERGQEQTEQVGEARAAVSDAAAAASTAAVVVPAVPVQPVTDQPVASSTSSPLVAADEDLIEKEWVDKAKEIIEQTKDDPHSRTQKVNELQRDYLQKRYGKVVGASE